MNKIKRYGELIAFILLTLVAFAVYWFYGHNKNDNVWSILGALDTAFAISMGVLAFIAYKKLINAEDEIKMYFKLPNNKEIDTGLTLLRGDCKRSEIMGLLGMIQKDQKDKYKIDHNEALRLLKHIQEVQKGKGNKIIINISKDGIKHFKVKDEL